MSLMRGSPAAIFELIRQHLALFPDSGGLPPPSPADEEAFTAQCRARLEHHGKVVTAAVLFMSLLWWPMDLLVLHGLPAARLGQGVWRATISLICLLHLLVPMPARSRGAPFWALAVVGMVSGGTMAYCAGRWMGGVDRPNFHLLYSILLFSLPLPLPLAQRTLGTGLLAASLFAGLVVASPQQLASPYLPIALSMLVAVLTISVGFGHLLLLLSRENFLQALQLQRMAAALRGQNEQLEGRVLEQTRELRRLLAHVESAREDERARISRELHDELGQELSALHYALAFTRQRYQGEPSSIGPNLHELEGLLGRTSTTTRQILSDLRPRVLDDLGLFAAAEWLVRRLEQRSDVTCRLDLRGRDEGLEGEISTVAFRTLQESLTNVARHARAARVAVALAVEAGSLTVEVCDDGAGFVVEEREGAGMGLLGMRERVQARQGELRIESAPAAGTRVWARLPLRGIAPPGRGAGEGRGA